MKRRMHSLLAVLTAGALLLVACGPPASPAPAAATAEPRATAAPEASIPLEGTEWALVSLRGDSPVAGSATTLSFYPANYMEGNAGCNYFGVDYSAGDEEFRLAGIHRTGFSCDEPPGIMPQDEALFEALASIAAYQATEDRLELRDAEGETILVYARKLPAAVDPALVDTEWLLTSLAGSSLLADSRVTLNLGEEGFEGYAGCNNYGGEYEAADQGVLLTWDISLTAMDCPSREGVMAQETAYIEALRSSAAYQLRDGHLEIADASGETTLVFTRKDEFATEPGDLPGTAWRLLSMDGERLVEGTTFTLAFYSDYILGGSAGCRDYLATYQATGDDLKLLVEAMFDAGCRVEGADLEQEAQFLGIMAPKADLRLEAGRLEIHGERGGQLLFQPLPEEAGLDLEGPTWSLLAFIGPNPFAEEPEPWPVPGGLLEGTTIDLTFERSAARGSTGCNRYDAAYDQEGDSLAVGPIAVTEMACLGPAGVMEQEGQYLDLLAAVTRSDIHGDRLWLETDDGRALVFGAQLVGGGLTPSAEPAPAPAGLVLQAGGLGMVHFGDDAGAVVETLNGILGPPDYDTGWQDPSLPSNEPLWPGCPGATARLLSWDESKLSVVLTDWAQNDLQGSGDARAGTGSPYFAGYGAGADALPQLHTPEGAYPGLTVPELGVRYGERLFVSPEPDGAVGLYWFAIDGTGSPLTRMGGIRGWLFEPDINSPDYIPGREPSEAFETRGWTAGLSCSTP